MNGQRSFWSKLTGWQRRNRYRVQVAAFLAAVILPFILFWSLNGNQVVLPISVFCLIFISMLLTAWAG